MNKILKSNPELYDEKRFQSEHDFNRFEWRLVNGIWINIMREFILENGIYILKKATDEN